MPARRAAALALTAATTLVAGCSSGGPRSSSTTSSTTAPTSTSAPTSSSTTAPGTVALTAWGATLPEWNNNHTADPSSPGSYWPRLPDGLDSYTSLGLVGGRVIHYVLNFDPAQNEADSKQSLANELPTDAKVVSSRLLPGCEQVVESSPTLASLTHADVLGELESSGGFDPSAVTRLVLSATTPGSPPPSSC
ncbi:MAG TPA: hypothetical protein VFA11_01980 [Acidimicrobiales bacterium]|nr:hypothetical protein [Acidimicrobiales bacterium]